MPESKFTIVFRKSPDYKIYTAPVIYGGPTPDGRGVLLNFCVDHSAFPSYVEHPVEESGRVDIDRIDNIVQVGNVEREIQAAVYLSVDEAERTVVWLNAMVKKLRGESNE